MEDSRVIRNISDTALWVACYRAMETDRPDAIFRDPFARKLAGERGPKIVATLPGGRNSAIVLSVRTAVLDEMILSAIRDRGMEMVVNLAAGPDTRPYRLDLPKNLRWVEVDLPGILDYKEEILKNETPCCALERVRQDLADRPGRTALFDKLGAGARRVLVITEGLLVYLEPQHVLELAEDLAKQSSFKEWLQDITSPFIIKKIQKRWGKVLDAGKSPMKFAPAEGAAFFRPAGWEEADFRSFFLESRRLRREMPFAWVWRGLIHFYPARWKTFLNRAAGYLLLKKS